MHLYLATTVIVKRKPKLKNLKQTCNSDIINGGLLSLRRTNADISVSVMDWAMYIFKTIYASPLSNQIHVSTPNVEYPERGET